MPEKTPPATPHYRKCAGQALRETSAQVPRMLDGVCGTDGLGGSGAEPPPSRAGAQLQRRDRVPSPRLDLEVLLFVAYGRSSRSAASLAILKFCRSVARSVARLAWRVTA